METLLAVVYEDEVNLDCPKVIAIADTYGEIAEKVSAEAKEVGDRNVYVFRPEKVFKLSFALEEVGDE